MASDIIKKVDNPITRKLQCGQAIPGFRNRMAENLTVCFWLAEMIKSRPTIVNRLLLSLIVLMPLPLAYHACAPVEDSPTAVASQISADRPSYTYDEVLAIAKEFSPDCRVQKRVPGQSP